MASLLEDVSARRKGVETMLAKRIAPDVYEVPLDHVNAWLIDHDGLTLISARRRRW
jgi:hypothetical protein